MQLPFIVADIGINANGNLQLAKKLIDMAVDCGADAVKFQKRDIPSVYTPEELDSFRESPWGVTFREQKEGLEFSEKSYDEIDKYCRGKGIIWFASPWDIKSVEFLKKYNLMYNKIASPILTNKEICHTLAGNGKHTFISTGMSSMESIHYVVNLFKRSGNPYTLLHCVSLYPCPDVLTNISMVQTLAEKFNCDVGYSGHEVGITPSLIAVAMGAEVIERHITLDRTMYGSDQSASLEKRGLELLVREAKLIRAMMGTGEKEILPDEEKNAKKLRYWEKAWSR